MGTVQASAATTTKRIAPPIRLAGSLGLYDLANGQSHGRQTAPVNSTPRCGSPGCRSPVASHTYVAERQPCTCGNDGHRELHAQVRRPDLYLALAGRASSPLARHSD